MTLEDLDLKIKKYESIYKKKPKSKVFVLLADLYRKKKDLQKAFSLCQKGIKNHPQLPFGYIALALIFLDMNKLELAVEQLEKAVELSPENLFAYKLLGKIYLQLKKPQETLKAYKMVLLLDPKNQKAKAVINKLEAVLSVPPDDTGFVFKNLKEVSQYTSSVSDKKQDSEPVIHPKLKIDSTKETQLFHSRLSILDSLLYKKDLNTAHKMILELKNNYKTSAAIQIIQQKEMELKQIAKLAKASPVSIRKKKDKAA